MQKVKNDQSTKWSDWLAPAASLLCLIHCVGFGLIALLSPSLLHFSHSHNDGLEMLLSASVVLFGWLSLRRLNISKKVVISFLAIGLFNFVMSTHYFHNDWLFIISMFVLSAIQLNYVLRHSLKHIKSKKNCSQHAGEAQSCHH